MIDSIDLHEFLSACEHKLSQREKVPPPPYWFCNDGDDEGLSYCHDCILLLRPNAVWLEDYRGGYAYEEDGSEICENCHCLLDYTLTDYGVDNELDHFSEFPFDWEHAQECFELNRVANGVFSEAQKQELFEIYKASINIPANLQMKLERMLHA